MPTGSRHQTLLIAIDTQLLDRPTSAAVAYEGGRAEFPRMIAQLPILRFQRYWNLPLFSHDGAQAGEIPAVRNGPISGRQMFCSGLPASFFSLTGYR